MFTRNQALNRWDEIRSNHVNGNLVDARQCLYKLSKLNMLAVIEAAMQRQVELYPLGGSGDIADLREIINGMRLNGVS